MLKLLRILIMSMCLTLIGSLGVSGATEETAVPLLAVSLSDVSTAKIDTTHMHDTRVAGRRPSIYALPYSMTLNVPNWSQMWINTGVYAGAFCGTLLVLECLPEDATTWNRAAITSVPAGKRWYRNIFVRNPELDHDKFYFNYILHPYAGAVYFMSARSSGFNFWRSLLYCSLVSTVGWEFGIEAFMERPSYQDIVITPVVGSIIGECFYKLKRKIVANDYRLWGSHAVGCVVAFIIDPVNELLGYCCPRYSTHNLYRPEGTKISSREGVESTLMPIMSGGTFGIRLECRF